MKTTIYYFSATGNSLHLAKLLSNNLGNSELVSITNTIQMETVATESERIGLVFPVYAWGLPRIVTDFLHKLSVSKKKYIFAVATCVAIPGNTLKELQTVLRQNGADLNAGFTVSAGRASLMNLNKIDAVIISIDRQRKRIKNGEARLDEIVSTVKNLKKHRIETSSWGANTFGTMFHSVALKSFKSIDSAFEVKSSCNGCGICTKVCPRSNIVLKNGLPSFNHNCELCHACIQWCPAFAIKHPNFDSSLKQYRNPAIQVTEMCCR